jgi:hypothetical protein
MGEPQIWFGRCGEKNLALPGIEPNHLPDYILITSTGTKIGIPAILMNTQGTFLP